MPPKNSQLVRPSFTPDRVISFHNGFMEFDNPIQAKAPCTLNAANTNVCFMVAIWEQQFFEKDKVSWEDSPT
jgi:putative SOS response-associated peptidase YedK